MLIFTGDFAYLRQIYIMTLGMLLTLEDAGVSKIDIIAPASVQSFLQSTQNFTRQVGNYIVPQVAQSNNVLQLQPYVHKEVVIYPIPLAMVLATSSEGGHQMDNFCFLMVRPIPGKFLVEVAEALGSISCSDTQSILCHHLQTR